MLLHTFMSKWSCVYIYVLCSLRISIRVELLGNMKTLCLTFWRTFKLFPKGTLPFYMPTKLLQSCLTLCNPMGWSPPGSSVHGILTGKNTGVGCHALLQGIFPTQGSNQSFLYLLHWQMGSLPLAQPGKPQDCYQGSKFFTFFPTLTILCPFSMNYPSGSAMVFHCTVTLLILRG